MVGHNTFRLCKRRENVGKGEKKGEACLARFTPASMVVIARSESPTRRSNPLNRVAQENLRQGRPLIPKGVVTSCLSALLAMTTWGTQRKRTTGRAESGVISNSQGHCRVAPSGLLAITTPDRLTQGDRRRECLCPSMVLAQSPRGLPRYACGTSPNHNLFGEVACSHS